MQYRKFGRSDWQCSALGFGLMRLPTLGDDRKQINEPEATRMLHHAIDQGVNYVDTAYGYHDEQSESFAGRALQGGYREKVRLATKLPVSRVEKTEEFDTYLSTQLERLQTNHVDVYLLHGLRAERWERVKELGLLARAERALADGRVKKLGFSFHDKTSVLKDIVDAFPWDMCQIQYNYMDVNNQAGTEGLRYAASKGLAVVVMEPLLGGGLVEPPNAIQALWDTAARKRTPVDWALQWVWNQPEVSVVLSGMSALGQVEQNLASASASLVGSLNAEELALVERVRAQYEAMRPIPCTECAYCMPCPNGVDIPRQFNLYNRGMMCDALEVARKRYQRQEEGQRASACIACGRCEPQCPQEVPIISWLEKVGAALGEN